jgi:hypothetical protein
MTRLMRIPQAGVSSIVDRTGRLCSQVRPHPQRLQVPWFADHNEILPLVFVVALHVCVWWVVALLFHAPSDIAALSAVICSAAPGQDGRFSRVDAGAKRRPTRDCPGTPD